MCVCLPMDLNGKKPSCKCQRGQKKMKANGRMGLTKVMNKKDDLNALEWKKMVELENTCDENAVTAQM